MNGTWSFLRTLAAYICLAGCITLTLTAPGYAALPIVSGSVDDDANHPIAAVSISLDGPVHRITRSDASGEFALENVPAGRYILTLTKSPQYARLVLRNLEVPEGGLALGVLKLRSSLTQLSVIGSVVARERVPFNTTPAALKVFPREAYRDQGQAAVSTVLTQTPGTIVVRPASGNLAQPLAPYTADVRGGLPWETAPLIDGNPIALPSSSTFDLAYVPSFVLQEVEVVKGYGSVEATLPGVVDGAVNLRTADPGVMRKGLLEVEADSRGGQFSDLAYGGTAPGGRFSFTTMLSADGNRGPVPQIDAAGAAFQRAQLLKARYAISPAVTGAFTYLASQGTLGVAVARGFELPSGFGTYANARSAQESHDFGLYSLELHADAGEDHFTGKAFTMRLQRTGGYDPFVFPGIGSGINALDDLTGFSLQDDRQIAGNLYQVQVSHRAGRPQAAYCAQGGSCDVLIPSGARTGETMARASAILNPAAQTQVQLSAAALWLHQRYSNDSGVTYRDATLAVPVGHAAAAFRVRPNVTARIAVGTGAAAPPAAMLNADGAKFLEQTPVGLAPYFTSQSTSRDVSVETSFGYDAGVEYRLHGDTTTLSADLYRVVTHGAYVDAAPAVAQQYVWINAGPLAHEGVDVALQQFKRVGLGFIVQASLLRDTPVPFGLAPPLLVPYAQGYTELSYKWPRGSRASIGALYNGANNPYGRPAFAQLNANLELSLNDYSKLQISVENLGNAYGGGLPLFRSPVNANVAGPRTFRFMFRQSLGGTLYEH
jgi:hypothetical protein